MNIKYHRINESELSSLPFSEGSMYFCKDTGKLYADPIGGGGTHILINDNIDDENISTNSTWSSNKIDIKINDKGNELTKDYNNKIKLAPPINILDNSDFRNPVNQRNITAWNYIGYGIDRWFTNGVSANISVTRNGLQGSANYLVQRFEKIKLNDTSKVTAAVQVNGAIYSGVINISNLTAGSDIIVITGIPGLSRVSLYYENNDICQFYFAGLDNVKIEWAALYIGEYSTETLPEYRPKGYGVELNTCLMFFERLGNAYSVILSNLTHIKSGSTSGIFTINFNKKRIIPTIRFSDLSQYRILYYFNSPNMSISATSISEITDITATNEMGYFTAKFINDINADCNGLMQRQDGSSSAWIDISADL